MRYEKTSAADICFVMRYINIKVCRLIQTGQVDERDDGLMTLERGDSGHQDVLREIGG